MEIILFNIVCFGIEFFKITIVLLFFYATNFAPLKRFLLGMVVSFIAAGGISCFANFNEVKFVYIVVLMVNFAVILNDKQNIPFIFIMYIYVQIIDMSIKKLLMLILNFTVEEIIGRHFLYVVLNMSSILIFTFITIVRLIIYGDDFNKVIKENKLLIVIVGAIITLYIDASPFFAISNISNKYIHLVLMAHILEGVIFVIFLEKLKRRIIDNNFLKNENNIAKRMLRNQDEYYRRLLKKENDTKAFRHDMEYHMLCMNKLYKENKHKEFEQYLQKFTNGFEDLKMNFDTGSPLINSVINDLSAKFKDVHIKCYGHFYDSIDLLTFDICTIVFNILKNAYEAAEKTDEKQIEFIIGYSETNLLIKLKNSALCRPQMKGQHYISDKNDVGHGYGLQNVCECVKRLGGEFTMSYSEGEVIVNIILFSVIHMDNDFDESYV